MEAFSKLLGGVAIGMGGIFILVILGTFTGALAGWSVGLIFGDTILGILSQLGIKNITMWQFGAFMGFAGGYLKTKILMNQPKKSTN